MKNSYISDNKKISIIIDKKSILVTNTSSLYAECYFIIGFNNIMEFILKHFKKQRYEIEKMLFKQM